ncbi:telomeric repeat binding factor a isoform X2 [Labeo rohita]|uniref:telomeric repeat binding factor a isoform X2 n=1 Tax=Labeo rohita TaxID=84645 RepID=UPI0021E257C5|nr:telomeric repeat binding factor a isoform X2 [Labeo rohita]
MNPDRMSECTSTVNTLSDEQIINRWTFDYYVFKAFSAFRNGDYTAFTHFTNITENLVVRPIDGHSDMVVKLRFMQFLSRINNGDKLDLTFEEPKTPLESALNVLESICRDMSVPQREQDLVRHAIIETLIMVCIRSGEFEKAEEMLLRHFSDAADSAGKKKLFVNLIRRRRSSHSVLQLSSYADFKQDMLDFIERLYCVPEPFLVQMLKRSGHHGVRSEPVTSSQDGQRTKQKTSAAAAEDHGGVSARPAAAGRLSLHSLRQVYGVLSERYGVSVSFTQLQEEVEMEAQQENPETDGPELHLVLSETPMEPMERDCGSQQQHVPLETRYAGMTISRLVQEDDSQISEEEEEEKETRNNISGAQEEEEETQISSPHRIVIPSGPDSDGPEVQTLPSSPPSARRTSAHNHNSESEAHQCSSSQISTPARHTRNSRRSDTKKYNRIILSSDVDSEDVGASPPSNRRSSRHKQQQQNDNSESECVMEVQSSSAQISTPVRPSSSSSSSAVRRSNRDTQKNHSIVLSSDMDSEDLGASPPSSRRSSRHKQQQQNDNSVGESAPVLTPARPSSPTSIRETQNHSSESECVMEVEDGASAAQHSTPVRPSSSSQSTRRSDTPKRNKSVIVSSESEDHSSSPARRSSSPSTSRSSGEKHKRRRARWQDVSGTHENWSDEESLFSAASGPSRKKYSRKMWTTQESEWLKEGVRRFGAGHWEKIRSAFPFTGRTAVNLKDRWRTMLKLRLV